MFGKPKNVKYLANKGFNGIDTSGVAVLEYEDNQAICVGGKECKSLNRTTIMAANGYVELNSAPNVFTDFLVNIDSNQRTICENEYDSHMVYEFKEFYKLHKNKDLKKIYEYLDHSLLVMEVAENLRKNAGIEFPCDENKIKEEYNAI